jgi:hypothetical protein
MRGGAIEPGGVELNKIKRGLDEALKVAQGDPATIANIKITPSCGCVFCDLKCSLYFDEDSEYFYHEGPQGPRIRCAVSNTISDGAIYAAVSQRGMSEAEKRELFDFAASGGPIIGDET